ncbi:MAG TPA: DUF3800 domain-containing protein [Candidatus Sumerlaeota bacterium]|nr:DUF3800 domain-containing protein [Candidatus Sumerlaeota bacterium]
MLLVYVDESGNRDPRLEIPRKDGTVESGDWLYVLTAVTLFDRKWSSFDAAINKEKRRLLDKIHREKRIRLQLADCEVKSNWVRRRECRAEHPFLKHLSDEDLNLLVDVFYRQLARLKMHVFAVLLDKRCLQDHMDQDKIHKKSWEVLCERIEMFMRARNPKHLAITIVDDQSKESNRSLAMKHSYFQAEGTTNGTLLRHHCELPLFVRSELSNGVQLADLCSYNIYRAFKDGDLTYRGLVKIAPHIWGMHEPVELRTPFSGLWVFPPESGLRKLVEQFEKTRASDDEIGSPK